MNFFLKGFKFKDKYYKIKKNIKINDIITLLMSK